jgi:hypothetical protein
MNSTNLNNPSTEKRSIENSHPNSTGNGISNNNNNNNSANLTEMNPPRKRKMRLGKNLQSEISPAYICNSNDAIFFKIIHSPDEFKQFHNNFLNNKTPDMTGIFNSKFTLQIFPDEKITGYKNLKILISLTPKLLFPHVKIIFENSLGIRDDIELLLEKHYEQVFEMDDEKFIKKLQEETLNNNKGKLIYNENNVRIYTFDILKENALVENWNFQSMCTFFVDGASFIPIDDNFWNYFSLYDEEGNLIGFSSVKKFYQDINKHRSMVSQFLILPSYQRKGYGQLLLDVS